MVNVNIPSLRMCAELLSPWEKVTPSQRRTKPQKKINTQVAVPAVQPVQKANTRQSKSMAQGSPRVICQDGQCLPEHLISR